MKLFSPIPAVFLLMLWGLLFPMAASSHSNDVVEAALEAKEPHVQFINQSAPSFLLEDESGTQWELGELSDQTLVVNFADSRCQKECASHMTLIAELQQMVNAAQMNEQVQFITIATENVFTSQTKTQIDAFIERFELDPENWVFLYGGSEAPDAGLRLAKQYGVALTEQDGIRIAEVATHLIDRTGQLRARFQGLEFQPINLVSYTNTLVYDIHADQKGHRSTSASPPENKAGITEAVISGGVLIFGFLAVLWWYRRSRKNRG